MRYPMVAALFALAACAEQGPAAPPPGTPAILVSSGGAFGGMISTTLYAGDVFVTQASGPFGAGGETSVQQGRPGVYAETLAFILAEGPAVARRLDPDALACVDYGSDLVRITPPVDGFSEVGASCPDDRVTDFLGRVRAVWPAPE